MKKLYSLLFAALLVVSYSSAAWAWSSTGGDGSRFEQVQETAVFFNNSGTTMSAGSVVILDLSGTGVTAASTLGSYIDKTSSSDDILVVGVTKSTSVADQRPVVVVTKGVVEAQCADSADAVSSGSAVGSFSQRGSCGGGSNLGIALEAGPGTDAGGVPNVYLWVDPTGAD